MNNKENKNELRILDIIDNWYHEHTRYHLVDVDKDVMENLIKPIEQEITAAIERARIEEVWKCHDIWFNYEPSNPCPYCMGEAHNLEHEVLLDRLKELDLSDQLDKEQGNE